MAWVWWLSVPVLATVLAACWSWLRSRPRRIPDTQQAMQQHADYLDALVQTARAKDRGPLVPVPTERTAGAEAGETDGAEPGAGR